MRPVQREDMVLPESVEAFGIAIFEGCRRQGFTRTSTPYHRDRWERVARFALEETGIHPCYTPAQFFAYMRASSIKTFGGRQFKSTICGATGITAETGWSYRRIITALSAWVREGRLAEYRPQKGKGLVVTFPK